MVVLAACAAPATEPTTTDTVVTTTTGEVQETTAPGAGSTSSTLSGRPAAPDFTLALGDGGSFTLSEGAKPVYLVFWAEW